MTVPANRKRPAASAARLSPAKTAAVKNAAAKSAPARRRTPAKKKKNTSWLRNLSGLALRHWKFELVLLLFLAGGFISNLDRASRYVQRLRGIRRFMPKPVAELVFPPVYLDYGVAAKGAELFGTVTRVIDGDTFIFKSVGGSEDSYKIRMWGIDAPESSQTYGAESRRALEDKILNRAVHLVVMDTDRYSRQVCQVYGDFEEDVNLYMVAGGNAWHFSELADSRALASAQSQAKKNKRGLWTYPAPEPPWEYRKK